MTFNEFIIEFRAENPALEASNQIDEASMYKWMFEALKNFGQLTDVVKETFVPVSNGMACTPEDFKSVYRAWSCRAKGYHTPKENIGIVSKSRFWAERVSSQAKWELCEPCCGTKETEVVTETVYVNQTPVDFYYGGLVELFETKHIHRRHNLQKYRDKVTPQSQRDFSVSGKTIYTNFKEGDIYLLYYGIEKGHDGSPLIPDDDRGDVKRYVETYVYSRFYRSKMNNSDVPNAAQLFQFYDSREPFERGNAIVSLKMKGLDKKSFKKLKIKNMNNLTRLGGRIPRI